MHQCEVCHFETLADDVAIEASNRLVVCLACYGRLTDTRLAMPKGLRREIEDCLRELVG